MQERGGECVYVFRKRAPALFSTLIIYVCVRICMRGCDRDDKNAQLHHNHPGDCSGSADKRIVSTKCACVRISFSVHVYLCHSLYLCLHHVCVCIFASGLVTRLLELARDEDLGIGGQPGDLTCKVTLGLAQQSDNAHGNVRTSFPAVHAQHSGIRCLVDEHPYPYIHLCYTTRKVSSVVLHYTEETQTLETKIASRAELVVCGMATIPEAIKVLMCHWSVFVCVCVSVYVRVLVHLHTCVSVCRCVGVGVGLGVGISMVVQEGVGMGVAVGVGVIILNI